jgi:hypothetical protein
MGYGRTVYGTIGQDVQVIAGNMADVVWRPAGSTLDWSTVAAVAGTDVTLLDGTVIKVGQRFLRYGQVCTRISNPTVQTIAATGATAGSFKLTGVRKDTGATTTVTVAFNAAAAAVQTAMDTIFGVGNTVVTGGPLPGLVTVTFQAGMQYVTAPVMTADSTGLTGGTAVVAATNAGTNTGMFGPYDPAAADGRAVLARDRFGILNRTVLQAGVLQSSMNISARNNDNPGLMIGGPLYKGRVIQSGVAAASLALGPTLAALEPLLVHLIWYQN